MKNILVLGYIVRGPLGGLVFHHLQYVLGLKRLGYRVLFLEDSEDYPACYDPSCNQLAEDPTYGLDFLQKVFRKYDLHDQWAYFDAHQEKWYGKSKTEIAHFCSAADVLLNLSGSNPIRPWTADVPVKIYVDTDPVFTQIHNLQNPDLRERTALHNRHFTFGENFGAVDCLIPTDGFQWKPTRQPVVPEIWPQVPVNRNAPFSTVMQWDSYPEVGYEGKRFGMKSASFEPYFTLPELVDQSFCLAVGSSGAPLPKLQSHGWILQDAQRVTVTPESYQQFISSSQAEWSVAKQGYVAARSGWVSERSCAYLASGRPVIVQDTGLNGLLPTDGAIRPFSTPEEAIEAIRSVQLDGKSLQPDCHELIANFFDYRRVLPCLLGET